MKLSLHARNHPVHDRQFAPLTVLAIADEINRSLYDALQPERWQALDLILSCGDLSPDYLDYLATILGVPVFYVRGNHDGTFRKRQYQGFVNVSGKIVTYRGVRIGGFEGSQRYSGGPVQYSEREVRLRLRRMRLFSIRTGAPDILITHAPPSGVHAGKDLCHQGFVAFNAAIAAWQPAVLVHGHTHAYDGTQDPYRVGRTVVLNAFPYQVFCISARGIEPPSGKYSVPHDALRRLLRP